MNKLGVYFILIFLGFLFSCAEGDGKIPSNDSEIIEYLGGKGSVYEIYSYQCEKSCEILISCYYEDINEEDKKNQIEQCTKECLEEFGNGYINEDEWNEWYNCLIKAQTCDEIYDECFEDSKIYY